MDNSGGQGIKILHWADFFNGPLCLIKYWFLMISKQCFPSNGENRAQRETRIRTNLHLHVWIFTTNLFISHPVLLYHEFLEYGASKWSIKSEGLKWRFHKEASCILFFDRKWLLAHSKENQMNLSKTLSFYVIMFGRLGLDLTLECFHIPWILLQLGISGFLLWTFANQWALQSILNLNPGFWHFGWSCGHKN